MVLVVLPSLVCSVPFPWGATCAVVVVLVVVVVVVLLVATLVT